MIKMKFIKGKYKKWLKNHETYQNYNYDIHDYFLQHEIDFSVTLYQVVFDDDYLNEDISYISKNEYLSIEKVATFNENDAKNLSCKEMKRYIMKKHVRDLYKSL